MEKLLSHIGTDGETDTGNGTDMAIGHALGVFAEIFSCWFLTLDYPEHDLLLNHPGHALHHAGEESGILHLHPGDVQAVVASFVLLVGAPHALVPFVHPV